MEQILLLRLEGPMQSWGTHSKWGNRDSALFPTKSGIIGLLACAQGLERQNPEISRLNDAVKVFVRADRPGTLAVDYQTVTGVLPTADGKNRGNKGEVTTIITPRQFLQDASFLVAVSGSADVLEKCKNALEHPVWTIYLGRKSFVPSVPVLIGLTSDYDSPEAVMHTYPLGSGAHPPILYQSGDEDGSIQADELVDIVSGQYRERRVSVKTAIEEV